MNTTRTHRHSESSVDADDALDHLGLTTTRRTWVLQRNEGMKQAVFSGESSIDQQTSGGLTMTTAATFSTPSHSTVIRASPVTPDIQQERATSMDLVWCREGEDMENGATPPTVLTHLPRPAERGEIPSLAAVRRRLSLHDGGRKSGTVASTTSSTVLLQTPLPANGCMLMSTPTPLGHMPRLLQAVDPPTESRELPLRPGCTVPSPKTPLWTALEEGEGSEEPVDDIYNEAAVVRLTLGRHPSSFSEITRRSLSMSPVACSAEVRRLSETDLPQAVLGASNPASLTPPKSQRQMEMERRKAWEEQMKEFFKQIDRRSLLTVNVDDLQQVHN